MYLLFKSIISKFLKKARLSSIRYSTIHPTSKVESGSSLYKSTMGKYSFCGYDCDIYNADIGCFTSIANQVVIGCATHPMNWAGMSPVFYAGKDSINTKFSEFLLEIPPTTTVGNDVWIGKSAIILSGVKIGNGAVVGAGSVVTNDIPAYSIVAGCPAKIIRYRFDNNIIHALEEINWWNLEKNELAKSAIYIKDPQQFIASVRAILKEKIKN